MNLRAPGGIRPILLGLALAFPAAVRLAGAETRVESLDLGLAQQSNWAPPRAGAAADGGPLRVASRTYASGIGTAGCSEILVGLDGRARSVRGMTGLDDTASPVATARFLVVGDGRVLYRGPWQQRSGPAVPFQVEIAGVRRLSLVVDVRGDPYARADWISPVIVHDGKAPVTVEPDPNQGEILAPPAARAPRFNMPADVGVRPGHPFLERICVAGDRPIRVAAEGLPPGISLNVARGALEGSAPASPGVWAARLSATNPSGSAAWTIRIVVGDRLALTPPQGWSAWYCMTGEVSDRLVREAAAAIRDTGLADHGWNYVLLDDFVMRRPGPGDPLLARAGRLERLGRPPGYYKGSVTDPAFAGQFRDAAGRLRPSGRFPDMPALTAWLHANGFKAGIYSSPGSLTCSGCTGSLGHEETDAALFAAWGFDLLKYDWCSYYLEAGRLEAADWEWPYIRMGAALRAQPRDLAYVLCEYGMGDPWNWGEAVGGQAWRVSQDMRDSWGGVSGAGFYGEQRDRSTGPGRWNDMDYLMIGRISLDRKPHPARLTRDEQRTQFALWCLRSSPLVLGGDPRALDPAALALLTNDEAIAIDRDPLGSPSRRVVIDDVSEAWVKPLAGGAVAVGLFNRDESEAGLAVSWSRIGLPGPWRARDLWRGRDAEGAAQGWTGRIPRHGVEFLRLEPAGGAAQRL